MGCWSPLHAYTHIHFKPLLGASVVSDLVLARGGMSALVVSATDKEVHHLPVSFPEALCRMRSVFDHGAKTLKEFHSCSRSSPRCSRSLANGSRFECRAGQRHFDVRSYLAGEEPLTVI